MDKSVEELFVESEELDDRSKARLAGLLLESIEQKPDSDVERLWFQEIDRRLKSVRNGSAELVPWEDVKRKVHSKLSERLS